MTAATVPSAGKCRYGQSRRSAGRDLGQVCTSPGEAKNTYGTGNFMLLNTGQQIVPSKAGLLTTVCYKLGGRCAIYALEGSIAVTGSAVQWLRDQLGIIKTASEIEALAQRSRMPVACIRAGVLGSVRAVLAFRRARRNRRPLALPHAGAPRAGDARGDLLPDARRARRDGRRLWRRLALLKVDGGATVNDTLMQLQADVLGVPVVRPVVAETTALGAAYAAGLATGFWKDLEDLRRNWKADRQWDPHWSEDQRASRIGVGRRRWSGRSTGWTSDDELRDTPLAQSPIATRGSRTDDDERRARQTLYGAVDPALRMQTWIECGPTSASVGVHVYICDGP